MNLPLRASPSPPPLPVEVFRTNVEDPGLAASLVKALALRFPAARFNFDLQDCDRILRMEGEAHRTDEVIGMLAEAGCFCEVLEG